MKRIWLFLICAMVAVGGAYAADEPVLFDLDGIEIVGSDLEAIQGQRPISVWEDGNRGYYRPGAARDYSEASRVEQDRSDASSAALDIVGGALMTFGITPLQKMIGFGIFVTGTIGRCQSSYTNRRGCFDD